VIFASREINSVGDFLTWVMGRVEEAYRSAPHCMDIPSYTVVPSDRGEYQSS